MGELKAREWARWVVGVAGAGKPKVLLTRVNAESVDRSLTPWIVAHQAPLSLGCSRQEYCLGSPFPCPKDLPDPGIKPASPSLQGRYFTV